MMTRIQIENKAVVTLFLTVFALIFTVSCQKDELKESKYDRPEWLAGKLYTQLSEQADLSTFTKCIELSGYDTIIDVSGSYTIFAPTDEAFDTWLANHPDYGSLEGIPVSELKRLIKYHMIQSPWSAEQLRTLDVFGWIDEFDENNDEPKGFKRETLLKDANRKMGIKYMPEGQTIILDTLAAAYSRRVITDSRKYVPIFYSEYFDIYGLSANDYDFYFDRPFEGGSNMNIANGKMVSDEIFAENGFIFKIDQVIEPLRNSYEILENAEGSGDFSKFLNLVNEFPEFQYNESETFDQEGADQGFAVDSLFDLTYPELVFNIYSEETQAPRGTYGLPSDVTIRYHHGLMAPDNDAFDELVNDYVDIPGGWGDFDGAPLNIKRIIANSHMSINAVYPTDFKNGFYNGEDDLITLNEDHIIVREFGSNCTFLGLNKAIVPRAFSSITGTVYLQQGYSKIMYAIEKANLLSLMKRENENYMFFVESDVNTSLDSSLIYDKVHETFSAFQVAEGGGGFTEFPLTVDDLRLLLFNHIASERPRGNASLEFVPNLSGGYIVINNETGEVSGTATTTVGFKGATPAPEFPTLISEVDNGATYAINNWFSFNNPTLFSVISGTFPEFHALIQKAGLSLDKEYRYNFISESEFYTVFAPNAEAIEESGYDTLSVEDLKKELLLHFMQGAIIFTDGNRDAGYYETVREDEASTPFSTLFSRFYVEPGIDVIRLKNKDGGIYTEIRQFDANTNMLTGILEDSDGAYANTFNNGVVHEIDKVLKFEELDTN